MLPKRGQDGQPHLTGGSVPLLQRQISTDTPHDQGTIRLDRAVTRHIGLVPGDNERLVHSYRGGCGREGDVQLQ